MPSPLIFSSRYRLNPGAAQAHREAVLTWIPYWEEHNPRMLYLGLHMDAAGEHGATVQVHPDAASLEMQLAAVTDDVIASSRETMDFSSFEYLVFGGPTEDASSRLPTAVTDSPVPTTVMPAVGVLDRLPHA